MCDASQLSTQHSALSTLVARAPVRISFGGGGTDLAAYYERFGGLVVSAAIARYCSVTAADLPGGGIRITSADYGLREDFAPGMPPPVEGTLALPKAAIEWFARQAGPALAQRGLDLTLSAEVPPGTGLGSSSAMAVALVRALAARAGLALDAAAVAEIAARLEIERLGMPIGKQDQYAASFGGLNRITFTASGVAVAPLDLPPAVSAALDERLLLFSTGRSRHSASILRRQRADTGADPAVIQSLHRIKALAGEMHAALTAADLDRFGQLLDLGWQQKRRLSRGVSSTAIDGWYAAARAAGALGGKITGAGGGGFLLLYCEPERRGAVRAALTGRGLRELPFAFDLTGARVLSATEAGRSTHHAPMMDARPHAPLVPSPLPQSWGRGRGWGR